MVAGIPPTDADREPWLKALRERIFRHRQKGETVNLACSALKQKYPGLLADFFAKSERCFVYLHAPTSLVPERMKSRHHPYTVLDLLDSRLATLEVPSDAWAVTVAGRKEEGVEEMLGRLREAGQLTTRAEKE